MASPGPKTSELIQDGPRLKRNLVSRVPRISPKIRAFPNAYLETDQLPRRRVVITMASLIFMIFGVGSVIADPLLLGYLAFYRTAPVLPLVGSVFGEGTPVGRVGGLDAVIVIGIVLVVVSS